MSSVIRRRVVALGYMYPISCVEQNRVKCRISGTWNCSLPFADDKLLAHILNVDWFARQNPYPFVHSAKVWNQIG
jgi:hypothetical protein